MLFRSQMMSCGNGIQVAMGGVCPTQTQNQTQFSTCSNGTQVPLGSPCPNTTTSTQIASCPAGTFFDQGINGCKSSGTSSGTSSGVSYCSDGITINTGAAGSCPTTSAGGANTGVTCGAGTVYDSGTKSCKSSTTTYCSNGTVNTTGSASGCASGSATVNSGPGYCANGYFWSDSSKSCQPITASTGTTNASLGYCPDGITPISASGTACPGQTATVKCSDGSYKFTAQLCPGQTPSTATGTTATSGVAYCADGITINTGAAGACPTKTLATSCPAGTFFDQGINGCKSSSVSTASVNQNCPAGSYYNQGAGGCTSSTAQVATIKCADGSYRVTALECQNSGGAVGSIVSSATGATCSSGYAPNSSGYCVPISNNASATQTIKCWEIGRAHV